METVGVRELKNNLSACLRKVAAGEVIQVTDHGRIVAELRQPATPPAGFESLPPLFWEKVARGEITLASQPPDKNFWRSIARSTGYPTGTAQGLIDADRNEE
ncbi:type II toxin-antitoxin system prevent-host-death family antitoxin [bacterium]|nr:type II toxin-antitoxin system prevent-host-death family antitoxin [bacterium]